MSDKTVAQKGHIRAGSTIGVVNGIADVVDGLGLPTDTSFVAPTEADVVLLFVRVREELDALMPEAVRGLAPGAILWVFFRKGGAAAGLDMTRDSVWEIAEGLDMRPLGIVGVDDEWSAFRLKRSA